MLKIKEMLIIYFILNILIFFNINAQDSPILQILHSPYSYFTNPAITSECKVSLGGLLIPISGQVMLPLYFEYNNNSFTYKDLIHKGQGIYSDSLIIDIENFLKKFKKIGYVESNFFIPLLYIGLKINKDLFLAFGINEKAYFRISLPKDLLLLLWEGNGKSLLGKDAYLGHFGLTFNWHREYYFGITKQINNKTILGVRANVLFGKINLFSRKNNISFYTHYDDYSLTLKTDVIYFMSQPFFKIEEFKFDNKNDSIIFETVKTFDFDKFSDYLKKLIFLKKNLGISFDVGTIIKKNEKYTFYISILNLGFINYKINPNGLNIKGNFIFDGWNIQPYLTKNDSLIKENEKKFKDSLINSISINLSKKAYNYWLKPSFLLGTKFVINDKFDLNPILTTTFFLNKFHFSFSIGANYKPFEWFTLTLAPTIKNNTIKNVGFGFNIKAKPLNLLMLSNNIFSFIWPQNTKTVNFFLGLIWTFSCKKVEHTKLFNTKFI